MLAEYTIALLLVAFCVGYLAGHYGGTQHERQNARRRIRRIRIYMNAGMRDW